MPYGYADSESGAIRYPTLSSLLSTAPTPGMRATALDAPGSMLYEVGGKWGGSLGSVSQAQIKGLPVSALSALSVEFWRQRVRELGASGGKKYAGYGASNMNNDITFWIPAVATAGMEVVGRYGLAGLDTYELLSPTYLDQLLSSGATDVIVGPGFNDMAGVRNPSDFQKDYDTLLLRIIAAGMVPHIVSIQDDCNNGFPGRASEYNIATYLLARRYGIQWNDVFIGLQNHDGTFREGMSAGDNVHMSAAGAAVSASRYAMRLVDGKSDIPLARASGTANGASEKRGLISNQAMVDATADGTPEGWGWHSTAVANKSVEASTDGFKAVGTVTVTNSSGATVIYYRNNSVSAGKEYKIAISFKLKLGAYSVAANSQYVSVTAQILTNSSGTVNSRFLRASAPGEYYVFDVVTVPAGSTRHDYSIYARGNASGVNVSSVFEISNFAAVDVTGLIL